MSRPWGFAYCSSERYQKSPIPYGESISGIFSEMAARDGFATVSGREALDLCRKGDKKASDFLVVADEDCGFARQLVRAGAQGLCMITRESPAVRWRAIDKIRSGVFNSDYRYIVAWSGVFDGASVPEERRVVLEHYPYKTYQDAFFEPWEGRRFLVMVQGLRVDHLLRLPDSMMPSIALRHLRNEAKKVLSPTFWQCRRNELQTRKFDAAIYFSKKGLVDVFGYDWSMRERLPRRLRAGFAGLGSSSAPQPCVDKFALMSGYRFAIAFENVIYPGYFSEKIMECFVAGTIPVYWGHGSWRGKCPEEAVIDAARFSGWEELEMFMRNMPQQKAMEMIRSGKAFLESESAKRLMPNHLANIVFSLFKESSREF